jgi:hypothetical protein
MLTKICGFAATAATVSFKSVNQVLVFWKFKFCASARLARYLANTKSWESVRGLVHLGVHPTPHTLKRSTIGPFGRDDFPKGRRSVEKWTSEREKESQDRKRRKPPKTGKLAAVMVALDGK